MKLIKATVQLLVAAGISWGVSEFTSMGFSATLLLISLSWLAIEISGAFAEGFMEGIQKVNDERASQSN